MPHYTCDEVKCRFDYCHVVYIAKKSTFVRHHFGGLCVRLRNVLTPSRLHPSTMSGDLAAQILQLLPAQRMKASDALHHSYFSCLPPEVYSIPDDASIFTVPGVSITR
jgi:hypothetical protein